MVHSGKRRRILDSVDNSHQDETYLQWDGKKKRDFFDMFIIKIKTDYKKENPTRRSVNDYTYSGWLLDRIRFVYLP